MSDTWLPWCIKRPGPAQKQGYAGAPTRSLSEIEGFVQHSAEGSLAALFGELDNPLRQASWHFSIAFDGKVYQHYPLEAVLWHCGLPGDRRQDTSLIGNITLIGKEHEGGGPEFPGQPLTEIQYQSSVRVDRDVIALCPGIGAPALRVNQWEHGWLSATSCPSGRIDHARRIADLEAEMAFTTEDKQYLGGLMRQTIKALTEGGAFLSALQGDPNYAQPAYSLKAIVAAIQNQAVVAGVTEDKIVAAVKKALKEGAG